MSVASSSPVEDQRGSAKMNLKYEVLLLDKQEGIVYLEDGLIKGGHIENIVLAVTDPKFTSQSCLNALFLTYRSFTTPSDLLRILIARFHVETPQTDDPDFELYFDERKRKPIQLRVGNCIRRWIDTHWYDFKGDRMLFRELMKWIHGPLSRSKFEILSQTLVNAIEKQRQGGTRGIKHAEKRPAPFVPTSSNFFEFHPKEVARQLALIEFEVYSNIHPTECMNQAWTKKEKQTIAPHIGSMIQRSNQVPMWVATQVLKHTEGDVKKRALMIVQFIRIARACDKLNNFNAVMEILAGLSLSPIHRLAKSWELVPQKYMDHLSALKDVMNVAENWKLYRNTLKNRDPPCIPYFGALLLSLLTSLTLTDRNVSYGLDIHGRWPSELSGRASKVY